MHQLELRGLELESQELAAALRTGMHERILVLMLNEDDHRDEVIPLILRKIKRLSYARDDDFDELVRYITSTHAD